MDQLAFYKEQLESVQQELAELQRKISGLSENNTEPIAIVGMAMRFPNHINSAQEYWNVLFSGTDCITDIPDDRWFKKLYDPDPAKPGKIHIKQFGFIDNIDKFDSSFFDISPVELENIDPQQRILLEVTYEAFENAGMDVSKLAGTNTAVFMGVDNVDYQSRNYRTRDYTKVNPYSYTGHCYAALSGRIAYLMGFNGPNFTLDTGCSSALTAAHVGCMSLRNRESDIAVIGAANTITDPEMTIAFGSLNALAPDSRSKAFDNSADGFARSEGCGVFILKRLSDAQRDKDNILALIKGSAINQDGRSTRFTAPSAKAQAKMHQAALKNAGIQPADMDYIETHGTGTKIGDPAEVRGILLHYNDYISREKPLVIGSVKSNLGHTEAAAGMAGMIKIVLALQHNLIPKSIHFKTPNELIDWNNIPVVYAKDHIEWKPSAKKRYAGVSGFGVTGSNAHVIIGEAPEHDDNSDQTHLRNDIYVLLLSAKSEPALTALAKKYHDFISVSDEKPEAVCAMAMLRRTHMSLRMAFVAVSKDELLQQLADFSASEYEEHTERINTEEPVKTVFVFPGQGAQWVQMGKALMENEIVYRSAMEEINSVYKQFTDWDLMEEINQPQELSRLDEIDVVQPVLLAVEIALANLWMSKGVFPDIVVGHSMGEVAAAYVAGAITLKEAAQIIITRSKLMKQLSGKGEMCVTDLSVEEAKTYLSGTEEKLSVAVVNSKQSVVISGDPNALQELMNRLENEGRFNRKVKVDVASHSVQMDSILDELENSLQSVSPADTAVAFYSTVYNSPKDGSALTANYWRNNLRNPVQFGAVIEQLAAMHQCVFIEMSPHPTLLHAIEENVAGKANKQLVTGSFHRDKNEQTAFYLNFLNLYKAGLPVDLQSIYPDINRFIQLPNYPWQRERYWIDEEYSEVSSTAAAAVSGDVKKNLYELTWEKTEILPVSTYKDVLLIKDNYGYFEVVKDRLSQAGCHVTVKDPDDDISGINPDLVVHMRSIFQEETYRYDYECGVASLQQLIRKFSAENKSVKISVVTNGVHLLNKDTQTNLNGALLTGLLRTIENEYDRIEFQHIDISFDCKAEELQHISKAVFAASDYKEIALRDQDAFAVTIAPAKQIQKAKSVHADATYIVSGGNNGLGFETVKWLAHKGAGNIVILSRSGLSEALQNEAERLMQNGTKITSMKCDVSDAEAVENTVHHIKSVFPPVKGVFHAAGILDDVLFENLTSEKFEHTLRPKANGAWNLHQQFTGNTVDIFVLFSSVAGILGSAGQSNYAAANTFLDTLSAYRNQNGLAGMAVSWGNIAEIGLAARQDNRGNRLIEHGLNLIYPAQLADYFDAVFLSGKPQLIAMDIDFVKWSAFNSKTVNNFFYSKVVTVQKTADKEISVYDFPTAEAAAHHIRQQIRKYAASFTKIPENRIKNEDTFNSMGIDSLLALQIKNKLQESFGLTMNVAAMWAHPTVQKMTDFIVKELKLNERFAAVLEQEYHAEKNNTSEKSAIEQEVESMSLDELLKQLNDKVS
jgi:acyl transferase domain-containing protein